VRIGLPSHADIVSTLKQQISVKDEQISQLQSALDQSQRLQALAESRHQAEQQQLAEIKGRSLLQRLKAVLWTIKPRRRHHLELSHRSSGQKKALLSHQATNGKKPTGAV